MLTKKQIATLFDERDGVLYWRVQVGRGRVGAPAGTVNSKGYLVTQIAGKIHLNHRLVYTLHKGRCPAMLDHRDGNPLNNRIGNLRPATRSENNSNTKRYKNNTSGVKGVSWCERKQQWQARIMVQGKSISLKYHDTVEAAADAVAKARKKYHGVFGRTE